MRLDWFIWQRKRRKYKNEAAAFCFEGAALAEVKWCDNGEDHSGPYFTVILIATEAGPGTRVGNRKRRIGRLTIARLCWTCLRKAEFRVQGQQLPIQMTQDPTED